MITWIRILVPALLITAAFAGCFGAGGDLDSGDDNGTPPGNGNGNGNGNETNGDEMVEAVVHDPVPSWSISISAEGADPVGPPFVFNRSIDLDFILDGSNTTVEDSTIDVFAWTVIKPDGQVVQQSGASPTFTFNETGIQLGVFGVYQVTLRALSTAGGIASTTGSFVLSMDHSYAFEGTLIGAGLPDCGGPEPLELGDITGEGIFLGTYFTHNLGITANATTLDLTLNYAADGSTEMRLYVFAPGDEGGDCGTAIGSTGPEGSPVSLSVDLPATTIQSSVTIRVQMEGTQMDGYDLDAVVTYADPGAAAGDE